jgi:hypothetical protein
VRLRCGGNFSVVHVGGGGTVLGMTKAAGAAAPVALAVAPGVASAGEGDDLHGSVVWTYSFRFPGSFIVNECTLVGRAQLQEFHGWAVFEVDDEDQACEPAGMQIELRYTDRFGNPATARAAVGDPELHSVLVAEADDVEGDLVADFLVCYTPDAQTGTCTTNSVRPK